MLEGSAANKLIIFKGGKIDSQSFKIAENNVKVHVSLENIKDIHKKITFFKK